MKRIGNLYGQIISIDNLRLADEKARKGKTKSEGVIWHDKNREANYTWLHEELKAKRYKTSAYSTFTLLDPKEREIYRLPYFPDRIVHHAVMNVTKPVFVSTFTADTYSCIEGKGILAGAKSVRRSLADVPGTQYCLKIDIRKFYPNIDHTILKQLLRRKFKDKDLLNLLDEIIDSTDGVPIGNYLSQYFANFYLAYFDHWIKEVKGVKHYFRYADDMVFFGATKAELHQLLADLRKYLQANLKLTLKDNYQVFPITETLGLDFIGYVFYRYHTRVRKSIKQRFARMLKKRRNRASIAAYYGWLKHCNGENLLNKLLNDTNNPKYKKLQRI